ncbi:MAG: phosphoesterase [Thermaerobacter sp.]|nr:phosphoesterase [Thermaerobacter sp.]
MAVLAAEPHPQLATGANRVPPFSHVFVIMMENQGPSGLTPQDTPYLQQLMHRYGTDSAYYGVTHVSLPNYVATLAGTTGGTHSDNPTQSFAGPTLASQLTRHHISWQAVMQSLPAPGYQGNWFPDNLPPSAGPATPPPNALYAKKHDPFLLFPNLLPDRRQVVPLAALDQELASGRVPRFIWITPNLCNDMHGQIPGPGNSCPESNPAALLRRGDSFLARLIPQITRSPAWTGNAAIFVTWDETGPFRLSHLAGYLSPGPAAPRFWGLPIGGGRVPLIVISRTGPKPLHIALWADHYSILKTVEASWGLRFLGQARSSAVPVLSPFFAAPR